MMELGRYAVFGHPIGHSRSPMIHQAFAAQFDATIDYRPIEAPLDNFAGAVRAFLDTGGMGFNITVPFKAEALALADELEPAARLAGAVNTMAVMDGRLLGCNTDGAGLVHDLQRLAVQLAGARIGILGAGGAAQGVLQPLLDAGAEGIWLTNRTPARAEALADGRAAVHAVAPGAMPAVDLLLGATAAGLGGDASGGAAAIPDSVVREAICYDLAYGAQAAFFRFASGHGAVSYDGLGMLVEQAALAFERWFGKRPATETVLASVRQSLTPS